jgi:hypothetical protein
MTTVHIAKLTAIHPITRGREDPNSDLYNNETKSTDK